MPSPASTRVHRPRSYRPAPPVVVPGAYCVVRVVFGPPRLVRWEALRQADRPRELWPSEHSRTFESGGRDLSRSAALRLVTRLTAEYRRARR